MARISITLKKSVIGYSHRQRRVVESLGLKRLNHSVEHEHTSSIDGMIKKIQHLVDVKDVE